MPARLPAVQLIEDLRKLSIRRRRTTRGSEPARSSQTTGKVAPKGPGSGRRRRVRLLVFHAHGEKPEPEDRGFARKLEEVMRNYRFRPARGPDGLPVAGTITVDLTF